MTLQDSGKKMSCLASAVSHNSAIMKNVEELMFCTDGFTASQVSWCVNILNKVSIYKRCVQLV